MQKKGKVVARNKYGATFIIIGAAAVVLGFILYYFLDPGVFYDLGLYVIMAGAAALLYGLRQRFARQYKGMDVELSVGTGKKFLTNNAIMIALLVMIIVIMIIQPRFMQLAVLLDILTQSSTKMIVALGISFTLLIAGTDLSAGRMVGLAAVVSTSMLQTADYANRFFPNLPHMVLIVPIIIAVIACGLFGILNGFLVAKYDMHPFIATLAVQVMVYGEIGRAHV